MKPKSYNLNERPNLSLEKFLKIRDTFKDPITHEIINKPVLLDYGKEDPNLYD